MILHKISHKLAQSNQVLNKLAATDKVLLCQDGVYSACDKDLLKAVTSTVYCIEDDCLARGIHTLPAQCQMIDYATFVELCAECELVISW